ncbi:predicted protein, partial [Postia placenta Mad-698-R]
MPKAKPFIVTAKHEPTGLLERIAIHNTLIGAEPRWAPIHLFSALASRPALRLSPQHFDFAFDALRRLRRRSFPIGYRTSRHAFTTATGPKWPYVALHLRVRHDVTLLMDLITDEAAKKQWAVRYPSIDVADLWETIESFIDVAKSYNDWKADIRALYPGADDTRKWSLADMDQLIGERARIGIHNAADLGCYYRDFMAITKHLIAQHRLSTIEQSRAFLRGFQPALLTRLETRLHLKHPDHYADDPYTMAEIHAAATFILHGTSSTPTTAANQATASTSNTSTTVPPGMIKTEDISMIIESLSRTIATLIQPTTHATHNHAPAPRQQAAVHVHENSGVEQTCHYCGNRGCRVGTCEFAEIDIRDGKCKRNTEGKIVLPNGSFCPRTIPGLTIRDRIY